MCNGELGLLLMTMSIMMMVEWKIKVVTKTMDAMHHRR
jgi:hypothetical protein